MKLHIQMRAWTGRSLAPRHCALNSTLIEMYKRNVLGSMRSHTLVHLNLFVSKTVSGFWRTPSFSMKSTQVLVHEAPGVSFIKLCVGSLLKMCVRPEAKFCVRQKIFRFIKHCVRTPVRNLCFINHILTTIVRS